MCILLVLIQRMLDISTDLVLDELVEYMQFYLLTVRTEYRFSSLLSGRQKGCLKGSYY